MYYNEVLIDFPVPVLKYKYLEAVTVTWLSNLLFTIFLILNYVFILSIISLIQL